MHLIMARTQRTHLTGKDPTQQRLAEAVAIGRECGDKRTVCMALWELGRALIREEYAAGRAMLEECLTLCRELGQQPWIIELWNAFGDAAWEQGDAVAAHAWWSDALRLFLPTWATRRTRGATLRRPRRAIPRGWMC